MRRTLIVAVILCTAALLGCGGPNALAPAAAQDITPHEELFRLPLPETLPDNPRVFCTQADLERIRADIAAGDVYANMVAGRIRDRAAALLEQDLSVPPGGLTRAHVSNAATLAQAYVLTGDETFGVRCRDLLVEIAREYRDLETTRARGRLTDSTLVEAPVAINASLAYDLIASAPFMGEDQRETIARDLLWTMAWECGHRCHHMNSSNWRLWALAIVASCGFAIGDRDLMEEAINGVWDDTRNAYLYGAVQFLTHSIFSDGVHWERSMGYHYYSASALMVVLQAAKNSGIDLWHGRLPGILGPFEGAANHEQFGPPGDRSPRAFLDMPFYHAFPDGSFALISNSGTRRLAYHRIYELAWREYGDPKYAWLVHQHRTGAAAQIAGWNVWKPRGEPDCEPVREVGREGSAGVRLRTGPRDRVALVQDVTAPADRPLIVTGWVRALDMDGGSAHIRANVAGEAYFTDRVREAGDWRQVRVEIPPQEDAQAGARRSVRLHVFLEEGAGEVVWDDVSAQVADVPGELVINGDFEAIGADGRGLDFWSLVNAAADVPPGRYDLTEDAEIGLSGRHVNGCTLLPVGGFAIMRADAADVSAPAVNMTYGPYGSGHSHPDALHLSLYGLGAILCPDAGTWPYDDPVQLTWANQTIAHNTVTVDEVAQEPQGMSDSIFAAERGDQRVFGVLRMFHPGDQMKAVRATTDTAYPGVMLDRTLCLVGPYALDVFRVSAGDERLLDLALHGLGEVSTQADLEARGDDVFEARGYAHLADVRQGRPPAGMFRADFREGERAVQVLHVQPEGGEVILARTPTRGGPRSVLIVRRHAAEATFVTVLEPYTAQPTVGVVEAEAADGVMTVTVRHAGGTDRFALDNALDGAVRLWRLDAAGAVRAEETAAPGE